MASAPINNIVIPFHKCTIHMPAIVIYGVLQCKKCKFLFETSYIVSPFINLKLWKKGQNLHRFRSIDQLFKEGRIPGLCFAACLIGQVSLNLLYVGSHILRILYTLIQDIAVQLNDILEKQDQ